MELDWNKNLRLIKEHYGFPLNNIRNEELGYLNGLEKRMVNVFQAQIFGQNIILLAAKETNLTKLISIKKKIQNEDQVVLVLPQLNNIDRKKLLINNVSFITLKGDFFLPSMNVNLNEVDKSHLENTNMLGLMGQRLFIYILLDMLFYEKSGRTYSETSFVETGLYHFSGGSKFINSIGEKMGVNNRVSFNRGMNDLIEHNLILASGETKNREYTVLLNSKEFFEIGEQFLNSPIKQNVVNVSRNDIKEFEHDLMISGDSLLTQVTMMSYEGPEVYVANPLIMKKLKKNRELKSNIKEKVNLQIEKYNLKIFNGFFRKIYPNYHSNFVDPIHLFLMYQNSKDDRLLGELDDLLDKIWEKEYAL